MITRRWTLIGLLAIACSGPSSTLKTVRSATGSGPIEFEVQNNSDVAINNLYMAKTEVVNAAGSGHHEPGSMQEDRVWGGDLLDRDALLPGDRIPIPVSEPGRWDVRVVDRDQRYQHIAGLKVGAGGRYILELGDGGWRVNR